MINKEINFSKARLMYVMPLLIGVLSSLFLCAFTGNFFGIFKTSEERGIIAIENAEEGFEFLFSADEEVHDSILEYYRKPDYTEWVTNFFAGICQDREVAQSILHNSENLKVPPALAFALCWEESKFNPRAINRYNRDGSIDRGLFQLNNRSFPKLDNNSFFDIRLNAYYGISHLRFCLDTGDSEIAALAMYNAGTGRVKTSGAPAATLNYISRILNNKSKIESRFHSHLIEEQEKRMMEREEKASQFLFSRTL